MLVSVSDTDTDMPSFRDVNDFVFPLSQSLLPDFIVYSSSYVYVFYVSYFHCLLFNYRFTLVIRCHNRQYTHLSYILVFHCCKNRMIFVFIELAENVCK